MTPIIKRNSAVPVRKIRKFTTDSDDMTSVNIRVFEGERMLTKDNLLFETDFECDEEVGVDGLDITVKYVHQLQNLYFSLTSEELTIK